MDLHETREVVLEDTGYEAILMGDGTAIPHLTISLDKARWSWVYVYAKDLIKLGTSFTEWGTGLKTHSENKDIMNLHKTRRINLDGSAYRATLRGDGTSMPNLSISLHEETFSTCSGYITAKDLITLGNALTEWGKELQAYSENK